MTGVVAVFERAFGTLIEGEARTDTHKPRKSRFLAVLSARNSAGGISVPKTKKNAADAICAEKICICPEIVVPLQPKT